MIEYLDTGVELPDVLVAGCVPFEIAVGRRVGPLPEEILAHDLRGACVGIVLRVIGGGRAVERMEIEDVLPDVERAEVVIAVRGIGWADRMGRQVGLVLREHAVEGERVRVETAPDLAQVVHATHAAALGAGTA